MRTQTNPPSSGNVASRQPPFSYSNRHHLTATTQLLLHLRRRLRRLRRNLRHRTGQPNSMDPLHGPTASPLVRQDAVARGLQGQEPGIRRPVHLGTPALPPHLPLLAVLQHGDHLHPPPGPTPTPPGIPGYPRRRPDRHRLPPTSHERGPGDQDILRDRRHPSR